MIKARSSDGQSDGERREMCFAFYTKLEFTQILLAADRAAVLHSMQIAAPTMTLPCFSALRSLCGAHIARGHPVTM